MDKEFTDSAGHPDLGPDDRLGLEIGLGMSPNALRQRIHAAVALAVKYGGIDGDHHRAWTIDQMVRALTANQYADVVAEAKAGEDGPETYEWDEGIAP